jgi:membrane protein
VIEPRSWYWLRLESIGYTLVAAVTSLAMAFLIVLGPLMLEAARRHIPFFVETNEHFLNVTRYGITILALVVALIILHAWLPAGRRGFLQILPGIIFTMAASLVSGIVFAVSGAVRQQFVTM